MLIDLSHDDIAFIRSLLTVPLGDDPTPAESAAHEHGATLAARLDAQRKEGGSPYYADMRAWSRENAFRQAVARMPYAHQLATIRMHPLDPIAVLDELTEILVHEVARGIERDVELRELLAQREAARAFFGTTPGAA